MTGATSTAMAGPSGSTARSHVGRAIALVALTLLLIACGLPVDERHTRINDDELPPDIGDPTTTSTTTTTTAPPTTQPATSGDDPADATSTTTVPPLATEPVKVFYTLGASTQLVELQLELPAPAQIAFLVDRLESPTDLGEIANLRTSVRSGLLLGDQIAVERGTVTIPLDAEQLARMTDASFDRAIAQIVLTFTSFRTPDQGNIGSVVFEVDGEGLAVFVPAAGGSSEPGEPLAFSDFAQLILTTPSPTTTTTRPAITSPPVTQAPPTTPMPRTTPPSTTSPTATTTSTTTTTTSTTTASTTTTTPDGG